MTIHQLHLQAQKEWRGSSHLRRQYPTFVFYWHEQYERVYQIPHTKNVFRKLLMSKKVH
jgi:hypothetical protein